MNVTDDPHNRQQAQIAIHISEFDGVADRIEARPAITRERLADYRHVRRIRAVTLVEDASSKERNSERLEISLRGGAEVCFSLALLLSKQVIE